MPNPRKARTRRSSGGSRAAAALLAAACAIGPGPADPALETRWEAVQAALGSQDWRLALELAESLEESASGTALADRAAALSGLAAAGFVQAEVEGASWAEVPRRWAVVGEEAGVLLHIENPTDRTLVLEDARLPWWNLLGSRDDMESLWEFTLVTLDEDAVGNTWQDTVRRHRTAGQGLVLRPGENATIMWADVVRTPFAVVRRMELTAALIPGSTTWGGRRIPLRRIRVPQAEILAYPRGVEELMDAPLESLHQALAVDSPLVEPHIALSARFLSEGDQQEGLGALMDALGSSSGPRREAILTGLLWATGRTDLARDPGLWQTWWGTRAR